MANIGTAVHGSGVVCKHNPLHTYRLESEVWNDHTLHFSGQNDGALHWCNLTAEAANVHCFWAWFVQLAKYMHSDTGAFLEAIHPANTEDGNLLALMTRFFETAHPDGRIGIVFNHPEVLGEGAIKSFLLSLQSKRLHNIRIFFMFSEEYGIGYGNVLRIRLLDPLDAGVQNVCHNKVGAIREHVCWVTESTLHQMA